MNNERPYTIFAKLDSDREARWWIRNSLGTYYEWEPLSSSLPRRTVQAHRLHPVECDFCRYSGDMAAQMELYDAKNQKARQTT